MPNTDLIPLENLNSPLLADEENISHAEDLSNNTSPFLSNTFIADTTLIAFLDTLAISENELNAQGITLPTLQRLWQIECSYWKTWRWINIHYVFEKLLHYPVIQQSDLQLSSLSINQKKENAKNMSEDVLDQKIKFIEEKENKNVSLHFDTFNNLYDTDNNPHIWLEGRGLPLCNESALRWTYAGSGFREGMLFATNTCIKLTLLTLFVYQLFIKTKTDGFQTIFNYVKTFFTFSDDSDDNSFIDIFQQLDSNTGKYVNFALLIPFVWGGINAALKSRHASLISEDDFQKMINTMETYLQETKTYLWWHDTLRWILPWHTLKAITHLEKLIRFEGRLTNDQRYSAFSILCSLAERGGYTKMLAIHALAKLAHGHAFSQFNLLQTHYSLETVQQFFVIKSRAFEIIDRAAPDLITAWQTGGASAVFQSLYAHYTKWLLADSNSTLMACSMFTLKTASILFSLLVLKTIFSTLIEYLNCPSVYQRGFTLAGGLQSWATLDTETCFAEYIQLFNSIPGQPANNLTSIMPNFDLRNFTVLDLSNKGLYGDTVAQILQAMWNLSVPLQTVNLSGNLINYPEDFDVLLPQLIPIQILDLSFNDIGKNSITQQGLIHLSKGLPLLSHLTVFNLANNDIGSLDNISSNATYTFGMNLRYLTQLTSLDLSENWIGKGDNQHYQGTESIGNALTALINLQFLDLSRNQIGNADDLNSQGTEAIGKGLTALTNLQFLDLSENQIGSADNQNPNGTIAISNGFARLTQLKLLRLSWNSIGFGDDQNSTGTIAIGNGLTTLKQLQYLDLSWNEIGSADNQNSNGTIAIGNGLMTLTALEFLDLSVNMIGSEDDQSPQGTVAIGNGLTTLTQLLFLNLSGNQIGSGDSFYCNGTQAIGKGLAALIHLLSLDLSDNDIGDNAVLNGTLAIAQALPSLAKLNMLNIMPQPNVYHAQVLMNAVRALPATVISDLPIMLYPNDVAPYFQHAISSSVTQLNWSGKLQGLPVETWQAIAENFLLCTHITSLDLSNNVIGYQDNINPNGTVALGNHLTVLTNLQFLDLSGNSIGQWDNVNFQGTQAIGNGFTALRKLQFLDLSENLIGARDNVNPQGTQAIGNGLTALRELQFLDLSENSIGAEDNLHSQGTQAIGDGFTALRKLQFLDLSGNSIGTGDNVNPQGTQAITNGINALTALRSLNLANNWVDQYNSDFTQSLGHTLSVLSNLQILNLAGPPKGGLADGFETGFIGSINNLGVLSLAEGLKNKTQLCEINFDQNSIGATGPESTAAILNTIATLTQLQIIKLSHLQNITFWSEAAAALAASIDQQLQNVCEASRCTGVPVNHTAPSCSFDPTPVPSASHQLKPPFLIHYSMYLLELLLQYITPPQHILFDTLKQSTSMTCHVTANNQFTCFNAATQTIRIVEIIDSNKQDITHDHYSPENCDSIQMNKESGIRCVGERTRFIEFFTPKNRPNNDRIFSTVATTLSPETINMLATAGTAALGAATCVLLPDAVSYGLEAAGCTKTTGETVKEEIQHVIEFISFTSTLGIASHLIADATHYLCQCLGGNEHTANTVSSIAKTTAIVIGTLCETSTTLPTIALSTAASMGAAYAANKIKNWFSFWRDPAPTSEAVNLSTDNVPTVFD